MTLYDFMNQHKEIDELTVWDTDYDIEVYFYPSDLDIADDTGKAEMIIAKCLNVVKIHKDGVTVNLSEVIKRNVNNGTFENLFVDNDVDSIMADIENIFAGYVSEKWLLDFAESLM